MYNSIIFKTLTKINNTCIINSSYTNLIYLRRFNISTKKKSKSRPTHENNLKLSEGLQELIDSYKLNEASKDKEIKQYFNNNLNSEIINNNIEEYKDHYPVFNKKIIQMIKENNNYIKDNINKDFDPNKSSFLIGDFTFGIGNLSSMLLSYFNNANVFGIDIDKKMIDNCLEKIKIKDYIENNRLKLIKNTYTEAFTMLELIKITNNKIISNIEEELNLADISLKFDAKKSRNITKNKLLLKRNSNTFNADNSNLFYNKFNKDKYFDYIILDLGFNSVQLSNTDNRGFSFKALDNTLDMRYDQSNNDNATAAEILNNSSKLELLEIFKRFGNEHNADLLVDNIIEYRDNKKFDLVKDLIEVIDVTFTNQINYKDKFDIYTRCFQALRMTVNYELLNIKRFISSSFSLAEKGCLMFIISFHSLEDDIVKISLKKLEKKGFGVIIGKKMLPDKDEINENSRSKSAMLRVFRFNQKSFV